MKLETALHERATENMLDTRWLPGRPDLFTGENLRRVFRRIYRVVRNVSDAQDLTQEVFLKALRHSHQIKDGKKAAHWLSRIATHTAIDFIRRSERTSFTGVDALKDVQSSPERMLARAEAQEALDAGLRMLTAQEYAALLLRDIDGIPTDQVAAQLACSKATVRSHIASARVKLRRHMEQHTN